MNRLKISMTMCAGIFFASSIAAAPIPAETRGAGQKPPKLATTTGTTEPATGTETIPPAEPAKVKDLAEKAGVGAEQVNAMRTSGMGWGEIKVAISLAQRISASETSPVPVGQALDNLLAQRQSGLGWGQIAQANGFKLGEIMGQGHQKGEVTVPAETVTAPTTATKPEAGSKIDKPAKPEKLEKFDKPDKLDKPEKIERLERPEKPEKFDKPEKLDKPDKPEKPQKPEKPEKPEHPAK